MKNIATTILFIAVAILGFTGCKKKTEITCNLYTPVSKPPVEMNIVYTATQTGDGTMASLTYNTISGPVTIQNPSLPWTITVSILTTTDASITATGTTKDGSLKISYSGTTGGSTISGSDFCEHSN